MINKKEIMGSDKVSYNSFENGKFISGIKISVVVPTYNSERTIKALIDSLEKLTVKPFEVIIIDDNSTDDTYEIAKKTAFNVRRTDKNAGPAKARNLGIKLARGDIIAFTDADCEVAPDWIETILKNFQTNDLKVLMGNVKIPKSTFLGDSISALGFPGGGSIGFDKVWKVDKDGNTDHITSCNFAVRKEVFQKYGAFDESFPLPGSEDPELSYRLTQKRVPIKFISDVIVFHEPRANLMSFVKWQITRGRGNYYFKKRIGSVKSFVKLRIWSSKNIIKTYYKDVKLPLIFFLLTLSFILQQYGYVREKRAIKNS